MNKFKIYYIIVIILSILMIFTKGFHGNMIIYSYNDADLGIIDGFAGDIFLSIINCFIITVIIISSIIVTINKNNKTNKKWLLFALIILLSLCIPIGIHHYSGGFDGRINEQYIFLWKY